MINKNLLYTVFFVGCSLTVFSQIPSGLYSDYDKRFSSYWFVTIKGDTAFSEEVGTKKDYIWIWPYSQDTLIKQNDNSYSGNKYVLKQKNGAVYLTEKNTKKNKEIPLSSADDAVRNGVHNRIAMWTRELYKKYSLTTEYLRQSSQNVDDIVNAFNNLEQKLYLDQQSFLVELQKFEAEYLYRKVIIED